MRAVTRRQVLLGSAAATLSALVGACAPRAVATPTPPAPTSAVTAETHPTELPPTPAPATTATATAATATAATAAAPTAPPPTAPPTSAAKEPSPTPLGAADMAVVRGADPAATGAVAAATERALAAIGGIERFVKPGYDVIIKPNICNANHGPEYASTTNPEVVAALVRMCLGAGAKRVRAMDYPFSGTAARAYVTSGIEEAVRAAGGEMEVMAPMAYVEADIPEGQDIKRWPFYQPILEADLVINVPIAKHHSLARLTLAGKNLLGVIDNRSAIHRNMGARIADLASHVRPQLTVMDAVRILMANGPTGGNLNDVKQIETVIAGADWVAVDAYATSLFGLRPEDVSYIAAAAERGLGTTDLDSMEVAELDLGGMAYIPWQHP